MICYFGNELLGWDVDTFPYLEAFSFQKVHLSNGEFMAVGSVDSDAVKKTDYWEYVGDGYEGEGSELHKWVRFVLDKYYGDGDTTDISV